MSLKELIHFVYNVSFVGIELLPVVFYFCDMLLSFVHYSVFFFSVSDFTAFFTYITSPGWMHETSARAWYTGETQRNRVEREVVGGIRMGNTCKSMADSCQCMTKTTTIL